MNNIAKLKRELREQITELQVEKRKIELKIQNLSFEIKNKKHLQRKVIECNIQILNAQSALLVDQVYSLKLDFLAAQLTQINFILKNHRSDKFSRRLDEMRGEIQGKLGLGSPMVEGFW